MGIRKRRARRNARTHIIGFGIAGIFGFIALLIATLAMSLGALVSSWLQDLPDYNSADAYLVSEPTEIVDANGTVIAEYYLQNRRSIEMDQLSEYVVEGIVDIEDERFYRHNGVDPQGIARAVVAQLMGGSEGASTITQQLVRNTVLSAEQFDYTLKRKVREAYLAIQMEKMYTKDQILMMYLNTIYFGHQAYGIQAASITYFNKNASDLTIAEAATLCGLPQSPSNYDPLKNPELATRRRNIVLAHMLSAGDSSPTSPTTSRRSCSRTSTRTPSSRAASRSTPPSIPVIRTPLSAPWPRASPSWAPTSSTPRSWPSTPTPATSRPWWADATTRRASSTSPRRRAASLAPRSSSSLWSQRCARA